MDGYTLSFEDWCTVSTRVFGSSSINEIGEKIKEFHNLSNNKVLDNSIDS